MCKPRRSGVTVAELLVALGLFSILLVLGISGLRISTTTGRSQGLAQELKGQFTQARTQAVSTGVPVAIVLPTSGGATPVVTECVILRGVDNAEIQRQLSFEGNYPGVGIFVGQWALPGGQLFAPPAPPPGGEPPRFSISNWLPPSMANHAAYVFLPSGQIVSNGQAAVDGEFPLIVASQFAATSGGGTATLTAAGDAYSVLVSERATARVDKGVLGGMVGEGGVGQDGWTLATLAPTSVGAAVPVITSVEVLPAPVDAVFAASRGAECIVEQDGVVSLKVKATDANGGPLYCQWTAADGGLSHVAETPMLYSPEEDAWISEWHWKPPATANVDDIFELSVVVRDESATATVATGVGLRPRVLVVDRGILAFNSFRNVSAANPDINAHVFVVRFDGTDLKAICESLCTAGFDGGLSASRDGRRIAIGADYGDSTLKLISTDGAEVKLVDIGPSFHFPYFSADSTKIYSAVGNNLIDPSTWTFVALSFDASGTPIETPSPYAGHVVGWSPDGTRALVQNVEGDILVYEADVSLPPTTIYSHTDPGGPAVGLDWNASGIFYANSQSETQLFPPQPGDFDVYKTDVSGVSRDLIGRFKSCADIGGDGRYLYHIADGIRQEDLTTGSSRLILQSFYAPLAGYGFDYSCGPGAAMWRASRSLSSSI
jgi:hypothetical protein